MKVSKETIVRTIVLIVALINQMLVISGKNTLPFTDEQVTEIISGILTTCASLWTWWKNNSFTKAAIEADKAMKEKKAS